MFDLIRPFRLLVLMILIALGANFARGQTSTFTYQGRLTEGGTAANGTYDLQFKLYDTLTGGNLQGSPNTVTRTGVNVTNGIFTVQLDFGTTGFPGADRFLDIGVKHPADASYTSLGPRQQLSTTPYAIQSLNAATALNATNSTQLGGVAANQFVQTNDTRMSDARDPLPGSTNYIQNGTTAQTSSNFNISGNGTAAGTLSGNVINATTQYNIGGNRVLSASAFNLFVGRDTGTANTTGVSNAFVGTSAGAGNQTGFNNSFFGTLAGNFNTSGGQNSFFGWEAGVFNTTAFNNSFFGAGAGGHNTTGDSNSFFGTGAGNSNTTGANNSFFGQSAGVANTTASGNAFFGSSAGFHNTTGHSNSFFGADAGAANTTAIGNSFFGSTAGNANSTGSFNSFFGDEAGASNTTAGGNSFFGYQAGIFTTSGGNSFFGSRSGVGNVTGSNNSFFGAAAGQNNSTGQNNSLFGSGAGEVSSTASNNSFFGVWAGLFNMTGGNNSFFGFQAGISTSTGTDNTFVGVNSGSSNTTENANTFLGSNSNGAAGITNATTIGANASVTQSNSVVIGSINGVNGATSDTNVGIGTTAPNARLHIAVNGGNMLLGDGGCPSGSTAIGFGSSISGCTNYALRGDGTDTSINRPTGGSIVFRENNTAQVVIEPGGVLAISALGGGPGVTLCRNNTTKEISNCSSSLRYKDHLASFTSGLDLINKLRPITFNWKQSGERDLGFAAEDVAAIEPLLVTYNDKGQIEGVKYDRLAVAFVNAFKEQQTQIQRQQEQIKSQQNQIDALRKLICLDRPNAEICK